MRQATLVLATITALLLPCVAAAVSNQVEDDVDVLRESGFDMTEPLFRVDVVASFVVRMPAEFSFMQLRGAGDIVEKMGLSEVMLLTTLEEVEPGPQLLSIINQLIPLAYKKRGDYLETGLVSLPVEDLPRTYVRFLYGKLEQGTCPHFLDVPVCAFLSQCKGTDK